MGTGGNLPIEQVRPMRSIASPVVVKTGGHWFIKCLQRMGVEFIFGTTGSGMPDIQDAMVIEKPPKWIQGLHEFVSVCAGCGYALASGKVGVAMIDRIVGTLNAAGSFYPALLSFSPVVVFASASTAGLALPGGVPEYHYHSNQVHPIAPWIKWSTRLESLETLPQDVEKAFFTALSEPQGPTYVTLRQDLMANELKRGRLPNSGPTSFSPKVPDGATLERVVEELLSHDNPQLLTSLLGRHPSAVHSLVRFAHTFGVAVSESRFFMNYPLSDPLHVGFVDSGASPELLPSTDMVIAIEMGLLPNYGFRGGVPVIDLTSDQMHRQDVNMGGDYGYSHYPAVIRAVGDSGPTLKRLVELGKRRMTASDKRRIKERVSRLTEIHDDLLNGWRRVAERNLRQGTIDAWSIGRVLNKNWSKDMILVDGTQSHWHTLVKSTELSGPGSYFGNPSSHLGFATGMAYGIALADRRYIDVKDMKSYKIGRISESSHTVVCTLGDGDAIMGNIPSALWTCKHYEIGVLYIILNNACWGIEWQPIANSAQHWSRESGDFEVLDIDKPRIDFTRIAEATNVYTKSASTVQELETSLPDCLARVRDGEPALLDILMPKYTGPSPSVVP